MDFPHGFFTLCRQLCGWFTTEYNGGDPLQSAMDVISYIVQMQ